MLVHVKRDNGRLFPIISSVVEAWSKVLGVVRVFGAIWVLGAFGLRRVP